MGNIYLIGFMGSGKSTLGRYLSKKLNRPFLDTDQIIQLSEGLTIPEIFEQKGEEYFRQKEKEVLKKLAGQTNLIVSTGGGLGADKENLKIMKDSGIVVWLDVSLEEILKRIQGDKDRPLINKPVEDIKKLYNTRREVYKEADIHLKADGKTVEQLYQELIDGYLHRD
ncbi:MAG: shikimate kinase [Aquificae bacterium]|nr:shikimate kinase [Aquificota bacterium]